MIDLSKKIWILDGAMGTMLQRLNLNEAAFRGEKFYNHNRRLKGCNDILCITRPNDIKDIHKQYLNSGADIIETNSFNANALSLEEYNLQDYVSDINRSAAKLAREAVNEYIATHPDEEKFVAGSIGPTSKSLSIQTDETHATQWDELASAYISQITALIEGSVDILLIETVFDGLNAKCALWSAMQAMKKCNKQIPIMLSITLTESGRTFSGQTLDALMASVADFPIMSIGLNCGFGADGMINHIQELATSSKFAISVHPNAGLPNELGQYDESPTYTTSRLETLMQKGLLNIVGGCCGTTPEHIYEIATTAKQYTPRPIPVPTVDDRMLLAGLETLEISPHRNFINVGERCNVAGSRKFLRLIKEGKTEEAIEIARSQIEAGATIIDINMDDGMLDAPKEIAGFLDKIASEPEIAKAPVMIDSSNWEVIQTALKHIQGKPIVNSISLKEGEQAFIQKAKIIKEHGAAVVVMCFDEDSQAVTFERKIEVAKRAYDLLTDNVGFNPVDIVIDPNILAVATGIEEHNNYALDFFKATEWIKQNLPGAKISGGVSNLSFAFRGNNYLREAMHSIFLYHNIKRGMDMAIVNAANLIPIDDIAEDLREAIENVLFNTSPDATSRLIEFAEKLKDTKLTDSQSAQTIESSQKTTEEKISEAIIKGHTDGLDALIEKALNEGNTAYGIINKAMMNGMNQVGELFGKGKMFLPQVVKSARVMKFAVDLLTPFLEKEKADQQTVKAGKVVIATVKGDVHDIGKNIVSIIMGCNGYEVIDLGVMVAPETILDTAIKENADFIGLSGLITPSLDEMCIVAKMMEERGMSIPLLVGGATTSDLHTAVKIAPCYSGAVVHTRDAAVLPSVVAQLSNREYIKELKETQHKLQILHQSKETKLLSLEDARLFKYTRDWSSYRPAISSETGIVDSYIPISQIRDHINWRPFFIAWKFNAAFAEIANISGCDHCKAQWLASQEEEERRKATEAMQLLKDANHAIDFIEENLKYSILARVKWMKATSKDEDIIINDNNSTTIIPTLRRQTVEGENPDCISLADFISPDASANDCIGVFAVTVGEEVERMIAYHKMRGDDYNALLYQSVADRLVEAATECFHSQFSGIRPAVGYPSLPDQSLILSLDKFLNYKEMGIHVTENGAMSPASTISGLFITNPDARYFVLGAIGDDQRKIYADKRGIDIQQSFKWIR